MKKTILAVAIGLSMCAGSGWAKTSNSSIEQRLQQLEARLAAAENRAAAAENQVQQLKVKQAAEIKEVKAAQGNTPVNGQQPAEAVKNNAATPSLVLSGYGDMRIYGDVEFNMDAESDRGVLAMTNADMSNDPTNEQWNLNGRIKVGFEGTRLMDNGYFSGFRAEPLADMKGTMKLDDAVFFFGQKEDWQVKVGRFEAYDMFPLNQDTFVNYSGDTANDLYDDGSGYIYMMKEGRGRSDAGGNFLVSKQIDNWYFELNSMLEDGTSLYKENDGARTYHGNEMEQKKNVAYLRPVIAWSQGAFSVAAAMESNVVNNAYGYTDPRTGEFIDQSSRTGYGMTMAWKGVKDDPENGLAAYLNTAYMDAENEQDFTIGANVLWKRFELGYIYAHNKVDEYSGVICDNGCFINDEGTYDIHTIHASYQIPNVMNMQNFNIFLGAYYSILDSDQGANSQDSDDEDRYGARVRFKYYF